MKRREFSKVMGVSVIGMNFPIISDPFNPWLYQFGKRAFIWLLKTVGTELIKFGIEKTFEAFTNDQTQSEVSGRLEDQGNYGRDNEVAFKYPAPKTLPSMPGGNSYAAFSYAHINPSSRGENAQALFLAKNHERKNLVALLPESMVFALCCAAKYLQNQVNGGDTGYKQLQNLLLPIEKTGEYEDTRRNREWLSYTTGHGKIIMLDGGIVNRSNEGKPLTLTGEFHLYPKTGTRPDGQDPFLDNYRLVFDEESLDFIFS